MTRQPSLEMRAFLFAFIPMALTLVLSFFVIGRAVEYRIKDRLRASLQETESLISRRESASSAQVYRALSAVSENPSLKAGIGLLRENRDLRFQEEARETLARQLERMGNSLGFELLLFEDSSDQPVIGLVGPQRSSAMNSTSTAGASSARRHSLRMAEYCSRPLQTAVLETLSDRFRQSAFRPPSSVK